MNNFTMLIGRAVKDAELTKTTSGLSQCRFSLAVDRPFKQGEEKETDFFNIVCWRNVADSCSKYLKKGMRCAVMGSLQNRQYVDKSGATRYIVEILASSVEFLDRPNTQPEQKCQQQNPEVKSMFDEFKPIDDADGLPF